MAAPFSPKRRPWWIAAWVCILLPAVLLARLMREHLVNIPFLDDYMFTPMLEKALNGFRFTFEHDEHVLTLHDFFMVQMEHRLAFVRALIMLRHRFWPADITIENWFTFAFLCGTALNVFILLRRTAGEVRAWWPVMAFATLAIFSPVQYQIVLWAMMFQVACPAFFLSMTLVVLTSGLPLWARWLSGVFCGLCAMLCIASGILVWLLPVFVMIFGDALPKGRARWIFIGTWLAALAALLFFYFEVTVAARADLGERKALLSLGGGRVLTYNMHNETDPRFAYKQGGDETMRRNVASFADKSERIVPFVLRLIGGNLSRGTGASLMSASLVIGGISVALLVAAGVFWLRRFKDEELRGKLAIWFAFGGYTVAAAVLVCLGRLWATSSGDNSISPRYVIHAVPLTVALGAVVFIIARDLRARNVAPPLSISNALLVASVTLSAVQAVSWLHGARLMETWSSARLRMATNTLFYGDPHAFQHVQTDADIAPNSAYARRLDEKGWLSPRMADDNRLDHFTIAAKALAPTTASWKTLLIDPDKKTARAMGFASLGGRKRVADGVILTYRDEEGVWRIFQIAQVRAMPLYLMHTIGRDLQNVQVAGDAINGEAIADFDCEFSLTQLPGGTHDLRAWAFDYREQVAYPIAGSFRLDAAALKARPLDEAGTGVKPGSDRDDRG
jgi:hypothetical protein